MNYISLRPITDLVKGPLMISATVDHIKKSGPGRFEHALVSLCGGRMLVEPMASLTTHAAVRIGLISALAIMLHPNTNTQRAISFGLLSVVSIPSALIVGGSYATYKGLEKLRKAYNEGSFSFNTLGQIGMGTSLIAAGWLALERHDLYAKGILEPVLQEFASKNLNPILIKAIVG